MWRDRLDQIIRTRGYSYFFEEKNPERQKISLKDLGRAPPEFPRIADFVARITEEIDNTVYMRAKRALNLNNTAVSRQ